MNVLELLMCYALYLEIQLNLLFFKYNFSTFMHKLTLVFFF